MIIDIINDGNTFGYPATSNVLSKLVHTRNYSHLVLPFLSVITYSVNSLSKHVTVPRWSEISPSRHLSNWEHGPRCNGLSIQLTPAAEERRQQEEDAAAKGDKQELTQSMLNKNSYQDVYSSLLCCGFLCF